MTMTAFCFVSIADRYGSREDLNPPRLARCELSSVSVCHLSHLPSFPKSYSQKSRALRLPDWLGSSVLTVKQWGGSSRGWTCWVAFRVCLCTVIFSAQWLDLYYVSCFFVKFCPRVCGELQPGMTEKSEWTNMPLYCSGSSTTLLIGCIFNTPRACLQR